jgi:protease I
MDTSSGRAAVRILILSADRFEDSELQVPTERLRAAGFSVDIAAPVKGPIRGKHGHLANANLGIDEVQPDAYAALVLPGGEAPARLRHLPEVLDVVRAFVRAGKPVAAICHGPQILAAAGVLAARTVTCYPSVADELKSAGARYRDAEVVVDGNLITSRQPADLPAFVRETLKSLHSAAARPERVTTS